MKPWKVKFTGDKTITLEHWVPLDPHARLVDYERINTRDKQLIEAAPLLLAALKRVLAGQTTESPLTILLASLDDGTDNEER